MIDSQQKVIDFPTVRTNKKDIKIIDAFKKKLQASRGICSKYHKRADVNNGFVSALGNQWAAEDVQRMKDMNAPALTLRYIHLIVNALSGRETVDRVEPVIMPFGPGDDAEIWNYFIKWDRGNYASRAESEAFRSALVSGLGLVRTTTNHNLWIPRTHWTSPEVYDYFWDTTAKDINFRDRTWQSVIMRLSKDKFVSMYPEHRKEVDKLAAQTSLVGGYLKYGEMQEARFRPKVYDKSGQGALNKGKREAIEVVLYEKLMPTERILVDYGAYYDVVSKKAFVEQFMDQDGNILVDNWKPVNHPVVKWYLMSGNKILDRGEREDWTVHPVTGFKHSVRKSTEFFGYVDLGKDAQRMVNKFYSLYMFGLATAPKNTYFAKIDAFDNIQIAEDRLAKGGIIPVESSADFGDILHPVERASMPDFEGGMMQVRQLMYDMMGTDPYTLGSVGDTGSLSRTSSKAISQVSGAGAQLAAQPLDNFALYKENVTRTQLKAAEKTLSFEQLSKIAIGMNSVGEVQVPPKETWKAVLETDIVIDHRPASPTEKQAFWESLTQMPELLGFITQGMPDLIPEIMPPAVPESFKRKLAVRIQQMMGQQEAEASAGEEEQGAEEAPQQEVA